MSSRSLPLADTEVEDRMGAAATVRRGLSLSPELRRGLPGTLAIAFVATAGRVIVPVAVQQIIDGGFETIETITAQIGSARGLHHIGIQGEPDQEDSLRQKLLTYGID